MGAAVRLIDLLDQPGSCSGASPVLANPRMKIFRYQKCSALSMYDKGYLVGTERFELSTYGLRVRRVMLIYN